VPYLDVFLARVFEELDPFDGSSLRRLVDGLEGKQERQRGREIWRQRDMELKII
jgi:hypothetical protein